jgi:hypothetical protein
MYIAKAGSATETRPIGIPTIEDKVLQRAVVMLLEPLSSMGCWCGNFAVITSISGGSAITTHWPATPGW